MFQKVFLAFFAAFLATGITAEAKASLLGQTVFCTSLASEYICIDSPAIVDPVLTEFFLLDTSFPRDDYWVDVGDDFVEITVADPSTYNPDMSPILLSISNLIWANNESAIIEDIIVTNTLFLESNVFIVGQNDLFIEMIEFPSLSIVDPFGSLFVEIIPSHDELPEPATVTLLGFGLAGLGWAARRRRAASS